MKSCFGITVCVLAFTLSCWAGNRGSSDELKEFYVAVDAVSDASPFWFKYVLHAEPVPDGSRIRYIRVAPGEHPCTETVTVKAASALLKETFVWDVPDMNLCRLTEAEVDAAIAPFRYKMASIWDTAAYGIVVKCGSEERLLKLPYTDQVDYDRLTKKAPKIGKLYNLVYKVVRQAFGGKSPLHDLSAAQDLAVQEVGATYLEELRSGRFDRGFWKGHVNKGVAQQFSMRAALDAYRGTYVPTPLEGRLVDDGDIQFTKYVPAKYPQMAKMARIEGKVVMRMVVAPETGVVEKADVVSGHPMLQENAKEAVRQWILKFPRKNEDAPRTVTLDFSFHCPTL